MEEMGLFQTIHTARALRRLKPDPVPDDVIAKVIDAAVRAPTGSNLQNWRFVVVKDAERRGITKIQLGGREAMDLGAGSGKQRG